MNRNIVNVNNVIIFANLLNLISKSLTKESLIKSLKLLYLSSILWTTFARVAFCKINSPAKYKQVKREINTHICFIFCPFIITPILLKNTSKTDCTLFNFRTHVRKRALVWALITESAVKIFNVFRFIAATNPPHKPL